MKNETRYWIHRHRPDGVGNGRKADPPRACGPHLQPHAFQGGRGGKTGRRGGGQPGGGGARCGGCDHDAGGSRGLARGDGGRFGRTRGDPPRCGADRFEHGFATDNASVLKLLKEKGADMLDAPVFGSKNEAEKGELGFIIGGEKEVLARVQDVFDCMGRTRHIANGRA